MSIQFNPFEGEFTVFAGVEAALQYLSDFRFSAEDILHLREILPTADQTFFQFLADVDASQATVEAVLDGTVVFPHLPLMTLSGPYAVCLLLSSALLNAVSYSSLVATNAVRFTQAAGVGKKLWEAGVRHAQGSGGATSAIAARSAVLGGFTGSHCLPMPASTTPVTATATVPAAATATAGATASPPPPRMDHSFVLSFTGLHSVGDTCLLQGVDLAAQAVTLRRNHPSVLAAAAAARGGGDDGGGGGGYGGGGGGGGRRMRGACRGCNDGELAAFVAYALAMPSHFSAVVDTYDTLRSGVLNFLFVSLALLQLGFSPVGIHIQSGDLAWLAREARALFSQFSELYGVDLSSLTITVSNELTESVVTSLSDQAGPHIDAYAVGKHLVTCTSQPALDAKFHCVTLNGMPCSPSAPSDPTRRVVPGVKRAVRLLGSDGYAMLDLLLPADAPLPTPGRKVMCYHPFEQKKRVLATPLEVLPLLVRIWDRGTRCVHTPPPSVLREFTAAQLLLIRPDHLRFLNPTPYKVSISAKLLSLTATLELDIPIQLLQ